MVGFWDLWKEGIPLILHRKISLMWTMSTWTQHSAVCKSSVPAKWSGMLSCLLTSVQ
jgi:hypothetical protein